LPGWTEIGAAPNLNLVLLTRMEKLAFRMMMVWRKNSFSCYFEYRSEDKKPLDFSDGAVEIKFCPWCGTNLNERYGPPAFPTPQQ